MQYKYINSIKDYLEVLSIIEKSNRVALDIETCLKDKYHNLHSDYRLNPHTARVAILTIKPENGYSIVFDLICLDYLNCDYSMLFDILESRMQVICHNSKFDAGILLGQFGVVLENLRCTLVLSQLLTNATGSKFGKIKGQGLKDLLRDFYDITIKGKGSLQSSEWNSSIESRTLDNPYWKEKIEYAATDTEYLIELHDDLTEVLSANPPLGYGMKDVVKTEMEFIPVIIEMEVVGLPANVKVIELLRQAAQEEAQIVAANLCDQLGLDTEYSDYWEMKIPKVASIKTLNNPKAMLILIQNKLSLEKVTSTQTATLNRLLYLLDLSEQVLLKEGEEEDDTIILRDVEEEDLFNEINELESSIIKFGHTLISDYVTYKKLSKQVSSDLSRYICPECNNIHSKYGQASTATGRLNSYYPNSQQIGARNQFYIYGDLETVFNYMQIN